ncbi:MAG: class I mannose-6-phosphate isomerase [Erythrobacter sp.]|nr:class I mannose-6-phosphate isomerase [Erythrobacter sp.]
MNSNGAIEPRLLVKPWGRDDLPPALVGDCDEAVGEIWFQPGAPLDTILTKYLFTSAKLSVQVHPTGKLSPTGLGKDECWLILDAAPGAQLATGFRRDIGPDEIREAAKDGSIEDLLVWRDVAANDFLYVPAGTVHAMGPGLTLVEVQQSTDITYRLYDYGRDRPLHLEEAVESAIGGEHPKELRRAIDPSSTQMLVEGPWFSVAQVAGGRISEVRNNSEGAVQVIPLDGYCVIGGLKVASGSSAQAFDLGQVDLSDCPRCLVAGLPLKR